MNYPQSLKLLLAILLFQSSVTCQATKLHKQPLDQNKSEHTVMERKALDLRSELDLDMVVSRVSSFRVIYVGEIHDDYADHLTQLEMLRRLHAINPNIAIGMEQFQQPFQGAIDRYIHGELDEKGLISETEWMERWKFDYRLYRPILSYARKHRIPVIALNLSQEIVGKVSKSGFDGLSKEDRAKIPAEIDYSDQAYHERLKAIYKKHAHTDKQGFERFQQVQLLWDEGMAERAAQYLKANPKRQLLVLAGSGHLMYGSGIPQRVSRRVQGKRAIILPAGDFKPVPGVSDFLVHDGGETLPAAGLMGIYLDQTDAGVRVDSLVPEGAAKKAGVKKGDMIRSINGSEIKTIADIKLMLMDDSPGDEVKLVLFRKSLLLKDKELELMFPLGN
ncbi:MAG: PDZ domain-containing protein [Gammaproteobacteria bacterium]|nr:PDZ domain-containing protein [Gammaproteobacteria bacterium]